MPCKMGIYWVELFTVERISEHTGLCFRKEAVEIEILVDRCHRWTENTRLIY